MNPIQIIKFKSKTNETKDFSSYFIGIFSITVVV